MQRSAAALAALARGDGAHVGLAALTAAAARPATCIAASSGAAPAHHASAAAAWPTSSPTPARSAGGTCFPSASPCCSSPTCTCRAASHGAWRQPRSSSSSLSRNLPFAAAPAAACSFTTTTTAAAAAAAAASASASTSSAAGSAAPRGAPQPTRNLLVPGAAVAPAARLPLADDVEAAARAAEPPAHGRARGAPRAADTPAGAAAAAADAAARGASSSSAAAAAAGAEDDDTEVRIVLDKIVGGLTKSGRKATARRVVHDALRVMRQHLRKGGLQELK